MLCRARTPESGLNPTLPRLSLLPCPVFLVLLFVWLNPAELSAQTAPPVDFANDVVPLLRQNCLECHGPKKQKNSLRLDRKSSALKPYSADASFRAIARTAWFISA